MKGAGCILLIISLLTLVNEIIGDTLCSANDNNRWSTKRNKCIKCPRCPLGRARNLTMKYEGRTSQFGDTQCLPCLLCRDGYYAEDDECKQCRKLCIDDYHREFQEHCGGSHDASCGSCLFGYVDTYRNIDMPCTENPNLIIDVKPEIMNHAATKNLNISSTDKQVVPDNDHNGTYRHIGLAVIFGISVTVIGIVCIAIFCILNPIIKRRRGRTPENELTNNEYSGVMGGSNSTSSVNDTTYELHSELEPDAEPYTGVTPVRAELQSTESGPLLPSMPSSVHGHLFGNEEMPRGELPQLTHNNLSQGRGIDHRSNTTETSPPWLHKCDCRVIDNCTCYMIDVENDKDIDKSDMYILIVVANICHEEGGSLFKLLKLPDAEIHAVEADRRRNMEEISLKEKVVRLLNRWVEMQCSPVKLSTLMKALCESNFHKINYKLKELVQPADTSLEHDNAGG